MKPTKEELIDIIYQCLGEVNEQLPNDQQIQKSPDATLVGGAGGLDSLGFVNFIALVEEKCAHKYGITVSLMEASSDEDAALENVGSFADSLFQRLTEGVPRSVAECSEVRFRCSFRVLAIKMKGLLISDFNIRESLFLPEEGTEYPSNRFRYDVLRRGVSNFA